MTDNTSPTRWAKADRDRAEFCSARIGQVVDLPARDCPECSRNPVREHGGLCGEPAIRGRILSVSLSEGGTAYGWVVRYVEEV